MIHSDDPMPYAMTRHFAPWLDVMVGVSPTIATTLRSMPEFSSVRIEEIPYGIAFAPTGRTAPSPADSPLTVIYLGRLIEEQKRISRVVELIQRCAAARDPIRFTVAGAGSEEAKIREQLSHCNNVTMRGPANNAEVAELLAAHEVFLLLSDYEGLPLTLLEAMGAGVTPLISDLESGIRDVVTDSTGYRVPIGDVDGAHRLLRRLVGERDLLFQKGQAAARLARAGYGAAAMTERFLALVPEPATEIVWPASIKIGAPVLENRPWLRRLVPRGIRRLFRRG
jgi:glycosyltransferase involved in cell wall biosynthesis